MSSHEKTKATLALPGIQEIKTLASDAAGVLDAMTKIVDFVQQYDSIPLVSSIASEVDLIDKVLHALDAMAHDVAGT